MNPEAAQAWNFALAKLASARRLVEQGQDEPAKTEIAQGGLCRRGRPVLSARSGQEEQAAHQAAQSFIADMAAEEVSAADSLAAARQLLGYIADMSPEEDKLPTP